jgi:hypothetical protein
MVAVPVTPAGAGSVRVDCSNNDNGQICSKSFTMYARHFSLDPQGRVYLNDSRPVADNPVLRDVVTETSPRVRDRSSPLQTPLPWRALLLIPTLLGKLQPIQ